MGYIGRTQYDLFESQSTESTPTGEESFRRPGNTRLWRGLLSGMIAGAAATWVMTMYQIKAQGLMKQVQSALGEPPQAAPTGEGEQSQENPTVAVANRASERLRGRPVSEQHRELAGTLVHYAFGTMNGALFGMASEFLPQSAPLRGIAFGTGLWAVVDELLLPATGLAKWWPEYPTSVHLNALGAHLVYGTTVDFIHTGLHQLMEAAEGPEVEQTKGIRSRMADATRGLSSRVISFRRPRRFDVDDFIAEEAYEREGEREPRRRRAA